jgi:hypothetical protein
LKRIAAALQIVIILFIVGYGTYHLFKGNFEVSLATVPLLVGYYLFMLALERKSKSRMDKDK